MSKRFKYIIFLFLIFVTIIFSKYMDNPVNNRKNKIEKFSDSTNSDDDIDEDGMNKAIEQWFKDWSKDGKTIVYDPPDEVFRRAEEKFGPQMAQDIKNLDVSDPKKGYVTKKRSNYIKLIRT